MRTQMSEFPPLPPVLKDESGADIIGFHGTTNGGFNSFQPNIRRGEQLGFGIHLAAEKQFALRYAIDPLVARKGKKPYLYTAKLRAHKPLIANAIVQEGSEGFELAKKLAGKKLFTSKDDNGFACAWMQAAIDATNPLRAQKIIQEAGYDAIIYESRVGSVGINARITAKSISYIVFQPEQVEIQEAMPVTKNRQEIYFDRAESAQSSTQLPLTPVDKLPTELQSKILTFEFYGPSSNGIEIEAAAWLDDLVDAKTSNENQHHRLFQSLIGEFVLPHLERHDYKLGDAYIKFEVNYNERLLNLQNIRVPQQKRRQGIATKAIATIIDYAEHLGFSIIASTEPTDSRTRQEIISMMLHRHGFTPLSGRPSEMTLSISPNGTTQAASSNSKREELLCTDTGEPMKFYRGSPHLDQTSQSYDYARIRTNVPSFSTAPEVASVYASKPPGKKYNDGSGVEVVHLTSAKTLKIPTIGVNLGNLAKKLRMGQPGGFSRQAMAETLKAVVSRFDKNPLGAFKITVRKWDDLRRASGYASNRLNDKQYNLFDETLGLFHVDAFALIDEKAFTVELKRIGYDTVLHRDAFAGASQIKWLTGKSIPKEHVTEKNEIWTYRPLFSERIFPAIGFKTDIILTRPPDNHVQQSAILLSEIATTKALADLFGVRVAVIRQSLNSSFQFNAASHQSTVWLNEATEKPLHALFGHEMVHHMRTHQPKMYATLQKGLAPYLRDQWSYALRRGLNANNNALIEEELIADLVAEHFASKHFWSSISSNAPKGFSKTSKFIRNKIDQIIHLFPQDSTSTPNSTLYSDIFISDLNAAKNVIAEVTIAYLEQYGAVRALHYLSEHEAKFKSVNHKSPHPR